MLYIRVFLCCICEDLVIKSVVKTLMYGKAAEKQILRIEGPEYLSPAVFDGVARRMRRCIRAVNSRKAQHGLELINESVFTAENSRYEIDLPT